MLKYSILYLKGFRKKRKYNVKDVILGDGAKLHEIRMCEIEGEVEGKGL